MEQESLQDLFNVPLSEEAYDQFCELDIFLLQSLDLSNESDTWKYIWGIGIYPSKKCYKHLIGSQVMHPAFKWLWNSHCQSKHKVFYIGCCYKTD
jgi:hypothetical protein